MSDAHDIADLIAGELKVSRGTAYEMMREALSKVDGDGQTTQTPTPPESLITIESSLRFRLECEKETSAGYLEEIKVLKGKVELGKKVWREDQQRIAELSARIDALVCPPNPASK